jgi:hypothetical protein
MAMMQAVRFHSYGGPEVLVLEEVPRPQAGLGGLRSTTGWGGEFEGGRAATPGPLLKAAIMTLWSQGHNRMTCSPSPQLPLNRGGEF